MGPISHLRRVYHSQIHFCKRSQANLRSIYEPSQVLRALANKKKKIFGKLDRFGGSITSCEWTNLQMPVVFCEELQWKKKNYFVRFWCKWQPSQILKWKWLLGQRRKTSKRSCWLFIPFWILAEKPHLFGHWRRSWDLKSKLVTSETYSVWKWRWFVHSLWLCLHFLWENLGGGELKIETFRVVVWKTMRRTINAAPCLFLTFRVSNFVFHLFCIILWNFLLTFASVIQSQLLEWVCECIRMSGCRERCSVRNTKLLKSLSEPMMFLNENEA